ncbi:MAG: VWA domain-containing protein [Methanobrevibacter olleyae]|uniref:VWA domain-containing protein n=1 Tax=Methanobrevibacter olleyae TaxID=294671 RepID=A0A8T3VTX0_METOL|nr:VWA domain-containing protein [Methanobrevibacter olleyae]
MDNESIKIKIQDQDEISGTEQLNKNENNLKGGNDMENENKTVVNDYNDEKLANIGIEEEMDLFFILDRSGSMGGSEMDTINGFNAFIEKQAVKNHNIRVTTILFDDKYEVLYSRKPISKVEPLTEKEYYVRGLTALLDSIGKTVNTYKNNVASAMCIITSDGYENASREFNRTQIKELIENSGWEFVFIGADIDSYSEASHIGIRKSRVANYSKTAEGHEAMYDACEKVTDRFYRLRRIDDDNEEWKEKLD